MPNSAASLRMRASLRAGEVLHLADHRALGAFAGAENIDGLGREILGSLGAG
jgi:hypothetical protein